MSTPFDGKVWTQQYTSTSPPPVNEPNTELQINIVEIGGIDCVTITFTNAPQNTKDIWLGACNVYYDRDFKTIRGELNYDTATGLSSASFGKHFVISYIGRVGIGGCLRQLSIDYYNEDDIDTPTDLLTFKSKSPTFEMLSYRGSWKADN